MTIYSPGAIVLVQLPFTNLEQSNQRPAVIISSRNYNAALPDVIVMAITSKPGNKSAFGYIPLDQWQHAGLVKPSWLKPILTTIEQRLIKKQWGYLHEKDAAIVNAFLRKILAIGV